MTKQMRNALLAWGALLLIVLVAFVWRSDFIQRRARPESYWRRQVELCEGSVEVHRWGVRQAARDFEKARRIADLEVAGMSDLPIKDEDVKASLRSEAQKEVVERLRMDKEHLRMMKDMLTEAERKLAEAKERQACFSK